MNLREVYMETINKIWCPDCDKVFYVNNGNVEDLTGHDIEGVICPHCKVTIPFIDSDVITYEPGKVELP